jgi:hypothetical protein
MGGVLVELVLSYLVEFGTLNGRGVCKMITVSNAGNPVLKPETTVYTIGYVGFKNSIRRAEFQFSHKPVKK